MMNHPYADHFFKNDPAFLLENMMGPNAIRVAEELATALPLQASSKVLDLGCGAGLSSIFLAEHYGATVFAADLWISPTDNARRFRARGLEEKILPLSVDVTKGLPFAQEYFDILLCVDAYHYFGANAQMLPFLLSFVKKGGFVAMAIPGLQREFENGIPLELQPFLPEDANFHTVDWWVALWSQTPGIELTACREMACHQKAWEEWLQSPNPYAQRDIGMMKAENGRYYNHVQMVAKRL